MAERVDQLVKMANQIALNMGAQSELDRVAQRTGDHIWRFWTPAMRKRLAAHARAGGEGLAPAVLRMLELRDGAGKAPG